MIPENHTKADKGSLLFHFKSAIGPLFLVACLLGFSSFRTATEFVASERKMAALPPDSVPKIDYELTQLLLREFKMRQLKDSLISYAKGFEGRPYHYGARGPKSFDCSGFVKFVYKNFGLDLERTSRAQSTQGELIPLDQVQKGDLLFFTGQNRKNRRVGHVAIVISEQGDALRFIHSASHGGVKIGGLDKYFEPRLLLARRVIQKQEFLSAGVEEAHPDSTVSNGSF